MLMFVSRRLVLGCGLAVAALLCGCGTRLHKAPVEDRGSSLALQQPAKPPPPGAENAGKPGYYTVKPGDILIRIGLETGQGCKDIARWNDLDNPNLIEVGQVLRVVPPRPVAPAPASPAPDSGVVTRPVTSSTVVPTTPAMAPAGAPSATAPTRTPAAAPRPAPTIRPPPEAPGGPAPRPAPRRAPRCAPGPRRDDRGSGPRHADPRSRRRSEPDLAGAGRIDRRLSRGAQQ